MSLPYENPTTWEQGCANVVFDLQPEGHVATLAGLFDNAWIASLGRQARLEYKTLGGACYWDNDFVLFLASKQHDYGSENINKFGYEGLKVRMWDKIARINNLLERGSKASNESLKDSYLDLFGYCVLFFMLKNGTFDLPLEIDLEKEKEKETEPHTIDLSGQVWEVQWINMGRQGQARVEFVERIK